MIRSVGAPALTALLILALAAPAHGWWHWPRTVTHYYPAPAVVTAYPTVVVPTVPVYAAPVAFCPPAAVALPVLPSVRPYARPTPAGPSTIPTPPTRPTAPSAAPAPTPAGPRTQEPPMSTGPAVSESRSSYFNAYAVAPRDTAPADSARCPVGFWNLTGQDLTITVANQTHTLPRGQRLKVDLDRQFVWRVEQREPQNQRVPDGEAALEIVIRR